MKRLRLERSTAYVMGADIPDVLQARHFTMVHKDTGARN